MSEAKPVRQRRRSRNALIILIIGALKVFGRPLLTLIGKAVQKMQGFAYRGKLN
jgi:hypothetical protein